MDLSGLIRPEKSYDKPERCSKCGGPLKYTGLGEYTCTKCGNQELDDYGKVRIFLENNPGANIVRTEALTGVSQKAITEMIREGKFEAKGFLKDPKGE